MAYYRKNKVVALAYGREWRRSHPEYLKGYGKKWKRDHPEAWKSFYEKNRDRLLAHAKDQNSKRKATVMEAYGNKCSCCDEARLEFLTIEHLYKNGSAHRKVINAQIYRWLIKNNFPKDGFTVYCYNCNMAEGNSRICPHKKEKGMTDSVILELNRVSIPQ